LLIDPCDSDLGLTLRLKDRGHSFREFIINRMAVTEVEDNIVSLGLDAITRPVDLK
jgi:hypothetical protein